MEELGPTLRRLDARSGPARSDWVAISPADQVRNDERRIVVAPPDPFALEGPMSVPVGEEAPDDAPDEDHRDAEAEPDIEAVWWAARLASRPSLKAQTQRHSRGRPVNGSNCPDKDRHPERPEHSLPPHEVAKRWRSGVSDGVEKTSVQAAAVPFRSCQGTLTSLDTACATRARV